MRNRVFAAILALLMLCAVLPALADGSDYTLRIDGGKISDHSDTANGSTFLNVDVYLDGITDGKLLASTDFNIGFDGSKLAFVSASSEHIYAVDATGSSLGSRSVLVNGESERVRVGFASDFGCRIESGKPFVTLRFRVKKTLPADTELSFTLSDAEAYASKLSEQVPGDDADMQTTLCTVGASFAPFTGAVEVTADGWKKIDGKWYYFEDGAVKTGWLLDAGKWYYLEPEGEFMGSTFTDGWRKVDGRWYFFNPGGHIARNTWKEIPDKSGTWYYFSAGGQMVTGWQYLNGSWYLFNPGGTLVTGWRQINGNWYYLGTGAMRKGWQQIGGKWYYFRMQKDADGKPEGSMVTGAYEINGKTYNFDANGVWIP